MHYVISAESVCVDGETVDMLRMKEFDEFRIFQNLFWNIQIF